MDLVCAEEADYIELYDNEELDDQSACVIEQDDDIGNSLKDYRILNLINIK